MKWLARVVALLAFSLVVAGASVTSTGSGLAVPDWPLSFGSLTPPMVGGIVFEHTHRLIAASVGFLTLILTLWMLWCEKRPWVRWLAIGTLALVVFQGLLGGLTVVWLLPPWVSIAHAVLGQIVFAMMVGLAAILGNDGRFSKKAAQSEPTAHVPPSRSWTLLLAVLIQLILGATLRHTGWHPFLVTAHIVLALGVTHLTVKIGSFVMLLFIALQWALGIATLATFAHPWVATGHVAVGALILALAVLRLIRTYCHLFSSPDQGGPIPAPSALEEKAVSQSPRWTAYIELAKPRLTGLAVTTALIGFLIAAPQPFDLWVFLAMLTGTTLVGMGAGALNQVMEWKEDAKMHRTRQRPIPSGRLSKESGLIFGVAVSVLGLMVLHVGTHPWATFLSAWTLIIYLFIYTPLKTRSPLCTLIGAIPGALPPLIGWTAARGALALEAWGLFAFLYLWQLPHFLALAWQHRQDYAQAGFKMLPVLDPKGDMTFRQTILYVLALMPVSLMPAALGQVGWLYFAVASASWLGFFLLALASAWDRSAQMAHWLFLGSVVYLPLVLTSLTVDGLIR
jgi:protoheme IX farnesyltransferase